MALLFMCRGLPMRGRLSHFLWLRPLIEACRLRMDRESERLYGCA